MTRRAQAAPLVTVALWLVFVIDTVHRQFGTSPSPGKALGILLMLALATALCVAMTRYLVLRARALRRVRDHRRATRTELDAAFRFGRPRMTVLVPSGGAEPARVSAALWSAALQEFPDLSLVLLIDDLHPADPAARARRDATRRLPSEIAWALAEPHALCAEALEAFRSAPGPDVQADEVWRLVVTYERAVQWLWDVAASRPATGHDDAFLVDQVFLALAEELLTEARRLRDRLDREDLPTAVAVLDAHQRLVRLFSARLDYAEGRGLPADLVVPDTDYVLVLEPDSLLVSEYGLRLVHELRRPGNADVVAIRAPHGAFPGAPTLVERVAGATLDLQHLHQLGTTSFDATPWAEGNAILRGEAVEDLVGSSAEPRRWRLLTYPERLSYSATPPDFGSLVLQRVQPGQVPGRSDHPRSFSWTNLAVPLLMLIPALDRLLSPALFLAAVPFLVAQALDLRRVGHRARDVWWVQALNLVLLPVNLVGAIACLEAVVARRFPFVRTNLSPNRVAASGRLDPTPSFGRPAPVAAVRPDPTVRTSAPALFVVAPYVVTVLLSLLAWRAASAGYWSGFVLAVLGCVLTLVGAVTFVGVGDAVDDLATALGYVRLPEPTAGKTSPVGDVRAGSPCDARALPGSGTH